MAARRETEALELEPQSGGNYGQGLPVFSTRTRPLLASTT